jgi:hypothetical protein
LWKSKNLNCGHVSFNMTNSAAPQTGIETRYPGSDFALEPVRFSSAACYKIVMPENRPRNTTSTLNLSSLGVTTDPTKQLINPGGCKSVQKGCLTAKQTDAFVLSSWNTVWLRHLHLYMQIAKKYRILWKRGSRGLLVHR